MKVKFLRVVMTTIVTAASVIPLTAELSYSGTTTFICRDNGDDTYTTVAADTPWGDVDIMRWGLPSRYISDDWGSWSPERRCNAVKDKLQRFYSEQRLESGFTDGTVTILGESYPVVCIGTSPCSLTSPTNENSRFLFMLEPGQQEYAKCVVNLLQELRFSAQVPIPIDSRGDISSSNQCI